MSKNMKSTNLNKGVGKINKSGIQTPMTLEFLSNISDWGDSNPPIPPY